MEEDSITQRKLLIVALEKNISHLQKLKEALELGEQNSSLSTYETKMRTLRQIIAYAKTEVETLLGYTLKPEHFTSCNVYDLLPVGYVAKDILLTNMTQKQKDLDITQADLKRLYDSNETGFHGHWTKKEKAIQHTQYILNSQKSKLLNLLMRDMPINAEAFSQKLAPHLDVMLAALKELRMLEACS